MRQTDLSIDELISYVSNTSIEKRCFFANELGVTYLEGSGEEKEKACQKLIDLLNDKEDDVRYPAYLFLRDGKDGSHEEEIKIALSSFEKNPDNRDLLRIARKHNIRKN